MEQNVTTQKIVVLNSKGGSGKTTVATNLAAYYASRGLKVALMDMDPQGSSVRWLKVRNRHLPPIHAIAAFEKPMGVTRSFAMRTPPGTETRSAIRTGLRFTHAAVRFDGGLIFGLTSRDPSFGFTAGITYVFRGFTLP